MSDAYADATRRNARRQELLAKGVGLQDLQEYEVLTLQLAEGVPALLRALDSVINLKNELTSTADDNPMRGVAVAFGNEIDRALKGQR